MSGNYYGHCADCHQRLIAYEQWLVCDCFCPYYKGNGSLLEPPAKRFKALKKSLGGKE